MKGTYLGEFQELVLLAIGILYDDAYGVAIKDELESQTGRAVTLSTVHAALMRLEEKGYVRSRFGGATEERGGRPKRLFQVTIAGKHALEESQALRNRMWQQIPKIAWDHL
ncbi:Transcriptional regulator PadR-like family protein [Catalinimonas alkaloidigena]|uniref:Transcriptional regulator PadR-like family protein n=1 Tax=Catalinimonas alkaloidigena TaxID=1075417 RepID=A0A1G8X4R6_9BACT|nr:PadR family transcriptional regulator [Catalinimonas alkaloidigena]SDJ85543.1 Transcriptional regulator PadR-like family protein [Catalinimonas alkaloidigena]